MNRAVAAAGGWSMFLVGIQAVLIGLRALGVVRWPWWLAMAPAELVLISLAAIGATIIVMVDRDNRSKRRV